VRDYIWVWVVEGARPEAGAEASGGISSNTVG